MKKIGIAVLILTAIIPSFSTLYADSSDVNVDGNPVTIDVGTQENIDSNVEYEQKIYCIRILWNTDENYCLKLCSYVWNEEAKRYELQNTQLDALQNNHVKTAITIINYSNSDIDYEIAFSPVKVNEKELSYETVKDENADKRGGRIASADQHQRILEQEETNTSTQMLYHGIIRYTEDYGSESGSGPCMGEYTVRICKQLSISKSNLTMKQGKSTTLYTNVPVSWSSSNTTVAKAENGTIYALNTGNATISGLTAGGRTVQCEVSVVAKPTSYQLQNASEYFTLLLDSERVMYTFNGEECIAYNGFIEETGYASYRQAQAFIDELNGKGANMEKVLPYGVSDPSSGYWHLLSCKEETAQWAEASKGVHYKESADSICFADATTRYGGVSCLWTELPTENDNAYYYNCANAYWFKNRKNTSYSSYGFVVIWTATCN